MSKKRWYGRKYFWLGFVLTAVIMGLGAWKTLTVKADKPNYLLKTVDRGDISSVVEATGTLSAVVQVDVGSQVSGRIAELHADFNSQVKKGQLLAKIDPDLFQAQVDQQEANVRTAEATLSDDASTIASMKAELQKAKVDVMDKTVKFNRQKELWGESLVSRDDFETAQAALDESNAAQKAADAQLVSAQARYKEDEARLEQTRASLRNAKLNLEHTIITSPISGTIINRNVDVGQTVAASFSAPTLFTVGEDLTKMQVNTDVDEADVGRLKTGMETSFSVDAYPGEVFRGKIRQVRLAATTVSNVVTYDAVIDVANPQLKLKPGMTANVRIVVEKAANVLRIPNSALRFKPSLSEAEMEAAFKNAGEERFWGYYKRLNGSQTAPTGAGFAGNNARRGAMGRPASGRGPSSGFAPSRGPRGRRVALWVAGASGSLRPVVVSLGLTDGVYTQLTSGKLQTGDRIVTGVEIAPTLPSFAARPPGFGGPMRGFHR